MKIHRGKIGSTRVEPRLDKSGVGLAAIPRLEPGYTLMGVGELGLIGAAPKDFLVFPACGTPSNRYAKAYVAKKPLYKHNGLRECVIEYLIARIGRLLPLRVAEGRLVRVKHRDSDEIDVRFMSRYFLQPDESLVHGVELVAQCFGIEKTAVEHELKKGDEERAFYTVDFVDEVLLDFGRTPQVHGQLRNGFARMLAFDALVGAVDRHASNWGVIEHVHVQDKRVPRFAPVFDTARGLLLHQSDDDLLSRTTTPVSTKKFLEDFAHRAQPLIGIPGRRELDYFDLVRYMVHDAGPKFGKSVKSIISAFQPDRVAQMIHREFHGLLHPRRLRLINELLRYRHQRLIDICSGSRMKP